MMVSRMRSCVRVFGWLDVWFLFCSMSRFRCWYVVAWFESVEGSTGRCIVWRFVRSCVHFVSDTLNLVRLLGCSLLFLFMFDVVGFVC